jgi:cell division protein FtsL
MTVFGAIYDLYLSSPVSVILVSVGCLLGIILLAIGIIVLIRKHRQLQSNSSTSKKTKKNKNKNTI